MFDTNTPVRSGRLEALSGNTHPVVPPTRHFATIHCHGHCELNPVTIHTHDLRPSNDLRSDG